MNESLRQLCVDDEEFNYANDLYSTRQRSFVTVMAAVFSPDGRYVVGGTSEGHICVWEVSEYKQQQPPQSELVSPNTSFPAHSGTVYCLTFTEQGRVLISGGDDNVRVWQWSAIEAAMKSNSNNVSPVATLETPRKTDDKGILAPVPEINGVAVVGQRLYSAAGDGVAYEWDLAKGSCTGQLEGHAGYLQCIGGRSNGMVITGSEDGTVKFWEPRSRECVKTLWHPADEAPDNEKFVTCLAVDPDDNWLIHGGGSRQLLAHHMQSGICTAAMPTAGIPQAVAFNRSGEVLSAGAQGFLHVWSTGGELKSRAATSSTSVFAIAVDPTSKIVATGGSGGVVDIFINPSSCACRLSTGR